MFTYFTSLPPAIAQGIIWGIMAIGVYLTYKILDMADLTVDGSICTGMAVCTVLIVKAGTPTWVGILCAMLAGMLAGLVTGIFHTAFGIPPILSGILTQLILWSVNLKIMGGTSNVGYPFNKEFFISTSALGMTLLYLVLIVALIIGVFYWFFGTELGSAVRATGCNLNMSRAQGINTDRTKVLGLVISNGIVALSGAILSLFLGFSDANAGRGAIVIGLAAVIIGEALFSRFTKNNFALKLTAVVAGGVIYYIVYQTVIFLGLDTTYLKLLSALLVAVFLGLPYWKKKYLGKHEKKKEAKKHA
ncbi:MAG: ABC transporter permease [Clostridia bacterium]|nr:ABC transporter permease [Clostridia bacterium]